MAEVNQNSFLLVSFPDSIKTTALIDSGSSRNLISAHFLHSSKYLSALPVFVLGQEIKLITGSNQQITVASYIKPTMYINSQNGSKQSYITPFFILSVPLQINLIIGLEFLRQVRASLNFDTSKLFIPDSGIPVKATKGVSLLPGKRAKLKVRIEGTPLQVNNIYMVHMMQFYIAFSFENFLIHFNNGEGYLPFHNDTEETMRVPAGTTVGHARIPESDRGACYMHMEHTHEHEVELFHPNIPLSTSQKQTVSEHIYTSLQQHTTSNDTLSSQTDVKDFNFVIIDKGQQVFDFEPSHNPVEMEQMSREEIYTDNSKRCVWLSPDDERLYLTDFEIITQNIDLSDSSLNQDQRQQVMDLCIRCSPVFSLRQEIGCVRRFTVDLTTDFKESLAGQSRPYVTNYEQQQYLNKAIDRLIDLGILEYGMAQNNSSIFLVPKQGHTKENPNYRIVVDLRRTNSASIQIQRPVTTLRDFAQKIGRIKVNYIVNIDLAEAFHSISITEQSKSLLGCVTTAGHRSVRYATLPMGYRNSSCYFIEILTIILGELPREMHDNYFFYFDDLVIFGRDFQCFIAVIEAIFKLFIKHGLVLGIKKINFCPKQGVQFLGFNIKPDGQGRPQLLITPKRVAAIKGMKIPTGRKAVKGILGALNYVSSFIPNFRLIVEPLQALLKKNAPFHWDEPQQKAWEQIIHCLSHPPILHCPSDNPAAIFVLSTDASRQGAGGMLQQLIPADDPKGSPQLVIIGYCSRSFTNLSVNSYSVLELELMGLYFAVTYFKNYLTHKRFLCLSDHSALIAIFENKTGSLLPTTRVMRIISKLIQYNMKIIHVSGNQSQIQIPDLLSRIENMEWTNQGQDIIPFPVNDKDYSLNAALSTVSCPIPPQIKPQHLQTQNVQVVPERNTLFTFTVDHNDHITNTQAETACPMMTRSKTAALAASRPALSPITIPPQSPAAATTKTQSSINKQAPISAVLRSSMPMGVTSTQNESRGHTEVSDLTVKGLNVNAGKAVTQTLTSQADPTIKRDVMPQSCATTHTEPLVTSVQKLSDYGHKLFSDKVTFLSKFPTQKELEKQLQSVFQHNFGSMRFPEDPRVLAKEQAIDPYFTHIHAYLKSDRLPQNARHAKQVLAKSQCFALFDDLLFWVSGSAHKQQDIQILLCIPEKYIFTVIEYFHFTRLKCHIRINKLYATIKSYFYIHNLYKYVYDYVASCMACQRTFADSQADKNREFNPQLTLEYAPFQSISYDIKFLFPSATGEKYLFVAQCMITRFIVVVPLKTRTVEEIAEAFLKHIVLPYFVPSVIISDKEAAFTSKLIQTLCTKLAISTKFILPYAHSSLRSERTIRSVMQLLTTSLETHPLEWPRLAQFAARAYNLSPFLSFGYSPHYLVFLRKERDLFSQPIKFPTLTLSSLEEYVRLLEKRFALMSKIILKADKELKLKSKQRQLYGAKKLAKYHKGDIVFLLSPQHVTFCKNRRLGMAYVGPLQIVEQNSNSTFSLATLYNNILPSTYHISRLKRAYIRHPNGGKVHTMNDFKEILNERQASLLRLDPQKYTSMVDGEIEIAPPSLNVFQEDIPQPRAIGGERFNLLMTYLEQNEETAPQVCQFCVDLPAKIVKWRWWGGELQALIQINMPGPTRVWYQVSQHPVLICHFEKTSRCTGSLSRFRRTASGQVNKTIPWSLLS